MPAQVRPPVRTIAFASALLASGFAVNVPVNTVFAADCLTAPSSPAPPDSHWYYRTDRIQQRKCWHLSADNQPSEPTAAQVARETSAASPSGPAERYSLATFKQFMAQNGKAKLSDQDVAKLYAEFLEWRRRTKN